MTNKDKIILELQALDKENMNAADYIECPYTVFDDCLMDKRGLFDYDSPEGLAACRTCKTKWLLKEEEITASERGILGQPTLRFINGECDYICNPKGVKKNE